MTTTRTFSRPKSLEYTESTEANELVAKDSIAFLIGFILDQQIRIQQAFLGPVTLRERLGTLDPHKLVAMGETAIVEAACAAKPIHRYPGSMGKRIFQALSYIVDEYDGDADQIWLGAKDLKDVRKRLEAVPGFGKAKAAVVSGVLANHFGMDFPGWDDNLAPYGSLAQVSSLDDLADYQARKGEYKKALKAKKAAEAK